MRQRDLPSFVYHKDFTANQILYKFSCISNKSEQVDEDVISKLGIIEEDLSLSLVGDEWLTRAGRKHKDIHTVIGKHLSTKILKM